MTIGINFSAQITMLDNLDCLKGTAIVRRVFRQSAFVGGATLAFVAAAIAPSDVQAQEQTSETQAEARSSGFDDIVVTARRIEENVQDVPVVVTALSGDALKAQNITAPTDLQFAAPSVTVQSGLSRLGGAYNVRGVNAGVVTYFSEAPTGPTTVGMPFFDLDSVQVLNGPQGTLFGRTAAAGAVLISPTRPKLDAAGGYIDVSVGNYGRLQGTGVLNVPLIEGELAIRAVYHHEHIDGFTKQIAPAAIVPGLPGVPQVGRKLDEVNNDSVRVGIEWKRGDFRNYAAFSYLNIDQTGAGMVLSYANPGLAAISGGGRFEQIRDVVNAEWNRIRNGGSVRETPAMQGQESYARMRMKHFVDVAEYDFGDLGFTTLRAKNVFSYQQITGVTGGALDGVGGVLLAYNSCSQAGYRCSSGIQQYRTSDGTIIAPGLGEYTNTITEEFQLQGTAADFINWTVGYFHSRIKEPTDLVGVGSVSRILSNPNGQTSGGFPFPNGTTVTEKAPFGQVTLELEKFGVPISLTAGYRDTKSREVVRTYSVVHRADGTIVPGAANPETVSQFGGSNYTFGISGKLSPDFMVYANHAKSFTPGGPNVTIGCHVAPGCSDSFAPATVKSYEFGFKSEFDVGDAAMRLNGALYRLDFSNIQQTLRYTDADFALIYVANVAAARINGAELQLDTRLDNLNLSLGYAYKDAKFTRWAATDINNVRLPSDTCLPGSAGSTCLIDLSGNPFQNSPKHQLNGSIRYDVPMDSSVGNAWVMLSGYYQSRQWHTAAPFRELHIANTLGLGDVTNAISQKAYGVLNFRVGWDEIAGSRLSAALFVNNLTNTTYSQSGSTRAYSQGTAVRLYAAPRMWGLNLKYEFGG